MMNPRSRRVLTFETLEPRLPLTANFGGFDIAPDLDGAVPADGVTLTTAPPAEIEGELSGLHGAPAVTPWADTRGVYLFNLAAYQGPWAPKDWTLPQWETWLDTMEFLNLNHLQLPRAPWSERPAETQFELDKEDLWISVLQSAKSRGMTTSLIFGTTWRGDLTQPWQILSPGNSPADPNWQTLVSGYNYWAGRYGQWVDEWTMGVEDPGGSPSSAGINWPFETPSPLGDPSNVSELVSLELEMRAAAQSVNPSSTVVAETWGLNWWGLSPGFSTPLDEFLANEPRLPADVPLSTHGFDDSITDALQATGRDVDAWPFFLIDHEFTVGHTKLHFNYTRDYLQRINNQGIDDVVTQVTHPMEQLPSLYIYSRLLEDTTLDKQNLLEEFSTFLVSDASDQVSLANAISDLGLFWESVSGIANWDAATLQPVEATAPYAPRYNATQLGYLDTALSNITAVDTPRAVSQIPMQISAATWVDMLRDQIQFLHDAANIGDLVADGATHLDNNQAIVAALSEPLNRDAAQEIVDNYLSAGAAGAIDSMEEYLSQFWSVTTGQAHPLGIIYDFLLANISTSNAGLAAISGDYLEYEAPSYSLLLKQLDGLTEETDGSFSYLQSDNWSTDVNPAYSGGTAMVTSVENNEVNIIFAGSGISLIYSLWDQGADVSWSIDGGAGGSGTVDMFSTTRQDQVETQLASGLAPTLHVLNIKKNFGGGSVLVDAVRVESPGDIPGDYNDNGIVDAPDLDTWEASFGTTVPPSSGADGNGNGLIDGSDFLTWQRNLGTSAVDGGMRLRRENDRDLFQFTGSWTETTDGTPSGDNWNFTLDPTATVSIPFEGSAIGISATTRGDYGVISWSIDSGAGGSGTVDLSSVDNTFRKQFILSTSLNDGPHTLVLAKQSGFLVNIDSIDTVVTSQNPGPSSVRFEAESTGAVKDKDDAVGFDSINGVVGRISEPTASSGEFIETQGPNRNVKIVFAGEGIDLVTDQQTNSAIFDWVLDEGAQTGSIDSAGVGGPQTSIPIISGLTNTLHTLELQFQDPPSQPAGETLRVDAFEVTNSGERTRFENDNPAIVYSPDWLSTTWAAGDQIAEEASGASLAVSLTQGSTATLDFTGSAVVLIANVRADGGIFSFDIDNGGATGTVDLQAQNALGFGNWHRWPILLSNNLAQGNHTLVLTALEANSGGRGAVNFDAIDIYGSSESSPLAAQLSATVILEPSNSNTIDVLNPGLLSRSAYQNAIGLPWVVDYNQKLLASRKRSIDLIMASELWRQPLAMSTKLQPSINKRHNGKMVEPNGETYRAHHINKADDDVTLGKMQVDDLNSEFEAALLSLFSE